LQSCQELNNAKLLLGINYQIYSEAKFKWMK
jgi:hypothetical protein